MRRSRRQPPFADRVDLWRPISGELLAAATFVPVDLAQRFIIEWYVASGSRWRVWRGPSNG
jgi:hypothetical protein